MPWIALVLPDVCPHPLVLSPPPSHSPPTPMPQERSGLQQALSVALGECDSLRGKLDRLEALMDEVGRWLGRLGIERRASY